MKELEEGGCEREGVCKRVDEGDTNRRGLMGALGESHFGSEREALLYSRIDGTPNAGTANPRQFPTGAQQLL